MFKDKYGYLVDSTGDAGDSAFLAGMATLFGSTQPLSMYFLGSPVRHPWTEPWNNPKNFSKDQLIVYMAGLWARSANQDSTSIEISRRIFWSLARRFFFCFNSERDYVGSTKYPWPHTFINDRGVEERRLFDFADIILPHLLLHIMVCCRYRWATWIGFFGYPFLYLSIVLNSKKVDVEQNQLIAMTKVLGPFWVNLYKKHNPNWQGQTKYYFVKRRQMPEMYDLIVNNY